MGAAGGDAHTRLYKGAAASSARKAELARARALELRALEVDECSFSPRLHEARRGGGAGSPPAAPPARARPPAARSAERRLENRTPQLIRARELRLDAIRRQEMEEEDEQLTFRPSINGGAPRQASRSFMERLDDMFFMQRLERQRQARGSDGTDLVGGRDLRDLHDDDAAPSPRISAFARSLERVGPCHERLYRLAVRQRALSSADDGGPAGGGHARLTEEELSTFLAAMESGSAFKSARIDQMRRARDLRSREDADLGRRMSRSSRKVYRRRLEKEFVHAVADAVAGETAAASEQERGGGGASAAPRAFDAYVRDGTLSRASVTGVLRALGFLAPIDATDRRRSHRRGEASALDLLFEVFGTAAHARGGAAPAMIHVEQLNVIVLRARMSSTALGCEYLRSSSPGAEAGGGGGAARDDRMMIDDDDRDLDDAEAHAGAGQYFDSEMVDHVAEQLARLYADNKTYMHMASSALKGGAGRIARVPPNGRRAGQPPRSPSAPREEEAPAPRRGAAGGSPRALRYMEQPFGHHGRRFRVQQLRRRLDREEMRECTFRPALVATAPVRRPGTAPASRHRLHEARRRRDEERDAECTFRPSLASTRRYYQRQRGREEGEGEDGAQDDGVDLHDPVSGRVHSCLLRGHHRRREGGQRAADGRAAPAAFDSVSPGRRARVLEKQLVAISDAAHGNLGRQSPRKKRGAARSPFATPTKQGAPGSPPAAPTGARARGDPGASKAPRESSPRGASEHVARMQHGKESRDSLREALTPRRPVSAVV